MRNVSSAWKAKVQAGQDVLYLKYIDFTLADGTELSIDSSQLWSNGFKFNDTVSEDDSFDIGSAIINSATITINNFDDQYTDYIFEGARAVCYIGLQLDGGTIEKIRICTMTVTEAPYQNSVLITLSLEDNMRKFDKDYSESNLTYPATRLQIVQDICNICDVTLQSTSFYRSDYIVQNKPSSDSLTCRQVLSWVSMLGCQWAKCDEYGRLVLDWYNTNPSGSDYIEINTTSGLTVNLEDVVITGVRVTEYSGDTSSLDDDESVKLGTYLYGNEGYVIEISENKLIGIGEGKTIASIIGDRVIGMKFRPLSANILTDVRLESGDPIRVTSSKGITYSTYITSLTLQPGVYESIANNAKSATRNSSKQYSQMTQIAVEARKNIQAEKSAREKAIEALGTRIDESSGVYTTEEKQEDGSYIFYLHNKPILDDSDIVWKMTSEAWGVSTDGGKTYNAGMTVDGDTIVRILTATGVNADWINTGALAITDDDGNIIFQADMDNKTVTISGDHVTIGGKTVTQAINDATSTADSAKSTAESANSTAQEALNTAAAAKNMTMQLSNDYQAIPVDANGNYTTFPTCTTTVQVMYGNTDITSNCSFTVTKSDNISGLWNRAKYTYMVYGLTADSAWVDIKATYLNSLSVTKRFTVTKLYSGTNGKMRIVQSGMTLTQKQLEKLGKVGYYNKNWATEEDLSDVSIGDVVMWSVTNSTKETTAYILIEVDGITTDEEGDYISGTSQGFIDSGADGTNGDAYTLESSANVFQFDANGTANPSEITFNAYSKTGNSGLKAYNGRFVLEYTKDGSSWTTIYTSPLDENSLTYPFTEKWLAIDGNEGAFDCGDGTYLIADTMSGTWISDITALRCKIYASGGTTTLLDMKVVDRVVSVEALTQEDIFNLLTNNGEAKGLYLEGGQLYISFTYAKGGTLAVGGSANKRGEIIIYDSNDNKIGYWDNTGINATKGTFSGALAGATGIFSGSLSAATGTFTGALKAATGSFSGEITASSGTIGGFKLASNALYSNRTSLTSNTYGVYISTGGISTGNGGAYITLSSGRLYGGISETPTGYVSFNSYYKDTGIYGIRICGKGCIALLTDGGFGIGSYYEMGSESTITIGQSGTVSYISSITEYFTISNICTNLSIVNGNATWNTVNATFAKTFNQKAMAFTKGLMTTTV